MKTLINLLRKCVDHIANLSFETELLLEKIVLDLG